MSTLGLYFWDLEHSLQPQFVKYGTAVTCSEQKRLKFRAYIYPANKSTNVFHVHNFALAARTRFKY